MSQYIARLAELTKTDLSRAGGKGANLGELTRISGISVPPGFCITTRAYQDFVSSSSESDGLLAALDSVDRDLPDRVKELAEQVRLHLYGLAIPKEIEEEIVRAWQEMGSSHAYAVRSSATAEDLPGASFAGQQDTFLNMQDGKQILDAVRLCWASLFTERAVVYRRQNNFSHRQVQLAVIVQQMIFSEVSGIMFTADPVSGNRQIVSIDASFGLGEALVSGLVSADLYQVKDAQIIKRQLSSKKLLIKARAEGGTEKVDIDEQAAPTPSLKDSQALQLASIGRQIEDHFGTPQDIEWAIAANHIYILQSRPITTLYPQPSSSDDRLHLYFSFGHVQMMTEAMRPLGISVLRTVFPFGQIGSSRETKYLQEVGNRLYADVTTLLRYPKIRERLPQVLIAVDESISRSIRTLLKKEVFRQALEPDLEIPRSLLLVALATFFKVGSRIIYRNNDRAIEEMSLLIKKTISEYQTKLDSVTGEARIEVIQEMIANALRGIIPRVVQTLPPAIGTYFLIRNLSLAWLGDESELHSISKSPAGNVTTEMGLKLGDLADDLRAFPQVVDYLKNAQDKTFWEGLRQVPGNEAVRPAFDKYFDLYGMRGTGEIDITRPRWYENPTQMIPLLLIIIDENRPGQSRQEFVQGKQEAEAAGLVLVNRLRQQSWGFFKGLIMKRLIKVHRSLIGMREHPKYFMVQAFWLVKQALLEEADIMVETGLFKNREDIFWFSLEEIKEIIARQAVDLEIMAERQERYQRNKRLNPPRLMTSEGEIIREEASADLPPGALSGSPVSAGVVEGRARVVLHLEEAKLDRGDILVAPYTDPSWTPLFTLAAGLVTEVGGLMTHGAVVAREYGIPAVVGVDDATRLIKDGQQIRVDGTQGFVQILASSPAPGDSRPA